MNIFKKFITIFIVLFLFAPSLYGEDKIVYLDLDNVVINTNAGKSILDQLEKSKKSAILIFSKTLQECIVVHSYPRVSQMAKNWKIYGFCFQRFQ